MQPALLLVATSGLLAACASNSPRTATGEPRCSSFVSARGPFASRSELLVTEPPTVWLGPERDVLLTGQVPAVHVYSGAGEGAYRITDAFELRGPSPTFVSRTCDWAWRPQGARGFITLNFECQHPAGEGLFSIAFVPSRVGLKGPPSQVTIRMLKDFPRTPPPPEGWFAAPLVAGVPDGCHGFHEPFDVRLDSPELRITPGSRTPVAAIPRPLATRMSQAHAQAVKYVFEHDDGWLVLFDAGEFGGGIEWYAKRGDPPRTVAIGTSPGDNVPQNVSRAMVIGGVVYVLQGLSHDGSSAGQLAVLWREHDHFTSQVIARYRTKPFDWVPRPDGSWLVATADAIWQTTRTGHVSLVARLPDSPANLFSLALAPNGTLYLGGQGGVLRLTPLWNDPPRYAPDFLMPKDSPQHRCWATWLTRTPESARPRP